MSELEQLRAENAALRVEVERLLAVIRASLHEEDARHTATIEALRKRVEELEAAHPEDLPALRGFAAAGMEGWPEFGGFDGFALQDLAEAHGLLVEQMRQVPCGDACSCAEYTSGQETQCCVVQPVLMRARALLSQPKEPK